MSNLLTTAGTKTDVGWTVTSGGWSRGAMNGTYGNLVDVAVSCATAVISGLTPNGTYDLCLFGNQNPADIIVDGQYFVTRGVTNNFYTINLLTHWVEYDLHQVTAVANGNLIFQEPADAPSIVSAWQLEAVPEPTSFSLLALTCALVVCRKVSNKTRSRNAGSARALPDCLFTCKSPDSAEPLAELN
jgi:hypothetical protein